MERAELVRRLLGVATHLFIEDLDPTSVHNLTCSAGEHAAFLSREATGQTFNDHILSVFAELTIKDVRKLRNQYWTPLKHAADKSGIPFNLELELSGFTDAQNDDMLYLVWYDYMKSGAALPIEAQVFQVWYHEMYPDKLDPKSFDVEGRTNVFSGILELGRSGQKSALQRCCKHYRNDKRLLSDAKTDSRPLVLGQLT